DALENIEWGDEYLEKGSPTSLDSPAGKAITTRQTATIKKFDLAEYPSEVMRRAIASGFKWSCNAPLIAHDRVMGAIVLVSRREDAFSDEDADLLGHISRHIAIAVENALNFEQARKERARVETLLEINNVVTT